MNPAKLSVFIGREVRVDRDEAEKFVSEQNLSRLGFEANEDARTRQGVEPGTDTYPEIPSAASEDIHDSCETEIRRAGDEDAMRNIHDGPTPNQQSDNEDQSQNKVSTTTKRRRRRPVAATRQSVRIRSSTASSSRTGHAPVNDAPAQKSPKTKSTGGRRLQKKQPKNAISGDEWEVDKIVDDRIDAETYVHYYLVQWKGWAPKHNTWEPKQNLSHCGNLIEKYATQAGGRKRIDK
ncbi:putative H3K9 methyltransferase [Purpureocillium lavendulum]|uniref:H3K9 methyltransferase n=1 Tax=Purpureocillium lavendulum TaxID=1247861 RepID=A0AB34FUA2_9HYPO|nr:putative H3K9 methyltransferase [Purpureocillium lavendulum]